MAAYLKIENVGAVPPDAFTVLGVSLADTNKKPGVIGQFGSGSKHSIALLLRNELQPIVFAGTLKLEFSTRPQVVSDAQATKRFERVVVKYGGVDPTTGSSRSATETSALSWISVGLIGTTWQWGFVSLCPMPSTAAFEKSAIGRA